LTVSYLFIKPLGENPLVSGGKNLKTSWSPFKVSNQTRTFATKDNDNIVSGTTPSSPGIKDFGKTADQASCQKACMADMSCTGYTWHDSKQGIYANLCRGRTDGEHVDKAENGHFSGWTSMGSNIYVADLSGQVTDVPGLQLLDKAGALTRATRARYPNLPGGLEASCGYGCMINSNEGTWTKPDPNKYGPVKFYTDNITAHDRMDTTGTWFQHYMIGTDGLCSIYDPPVSYWCSEHPSGGGAFAFRTPTGVTVKEGALPNTPYKNVEDVILNVWRPSRWANWMFEVADGGYDSKTNEFKFGKGGNQGARGNDKGGDFFIENVMEELDSPGEFFFDKTASKLYLFYNGTGAPPADTTFIAPQIPTLVNISGSQADPVKDFTVDGIRFTGARYTYMGPHGVPSAGDWALDRIGAIFIEGSTGTKFSNCGFERLDGNAVMVSGFNRNATVTGSDFEYIGGNAVAAWGYTNETENTGFPYYRPNTNYPKGGVDGTDGNHPRYTTITSNLAREVGLYEKQSSFYVQAKTAQSTISGNGEC
jgi:hypothetical protein